LALLLRRQYEFSQCGINKWNILKIYLTNSLNPANHRSSRDTNGILIPLTQETAEQARMNTTRRSKAAFPPEVESMSNQYGGAGVSARPQYTWKRAHHKVIHASGATTGIKRNAVTLDGTLISAWDSSYTHLNKSGPAMTAYGTLDPITRNLNLNVEIPEF
jgi:hypothetical protein